MNKTCKNIFFSQTNNLIMSQSNYITRERKKEIRNILVHLATMCRNNFLIVLRISSLEDY